MKDALAGLTLVCMTIGLLVAVFAWIGSANTTEWTEIDDRCYVHEWRDYRFMPPFHVAEKKRTVYCKEAR